MLKARVGSRLASRLFDYLAEATTVEWEWVGSDRFERAKTMFIKLADQGHSFTDCTSLVIAKERAIEEVITADRHFRISGLWILLGRG